MNIYDCANCNAELEGPAGLCSACEGFHFICDDCGAVEDKEKCHIATTGEKLCIGCYLNSPAAIDIKKDKNEIKIRFKAIEKLYIEIDEIADAAMIRENKRILHAGFDGQTINGFYDDAQWFKIKILWDCPDSPFGFCMYNKVHDKAMDSCVFCGNPYERK